MMYIIPCLFKFYGEYIMRNDTLDESQATIKIGKRIINNLTYADDNTLMSESKEKLKRVLIKVKEESEKAGLHVNNNKKTRLKVSGPITSWQIVGETMGSVTRLYIPVLHNHCRW